MDLSQSTAAELAVDHCLWPSELNSSVTRNFSLYLPWCWVSSPVGIEICTMLLTPLPHWRGLLGSIAACTGVGAELSSTALAWAHHGSQYSCNCKVLLVPGVFPEAGDIHLICIRWSWLCSHWCTVSDGQERFLLSWEKSQECWREVPAYSWWLLWRCRLGTQAYERWREGHTPTLFAFVSSIETVN